MMREIDVSQVEKTVCDLFLSACCEIGDDVLRLLRQRMESEESPFGKEVLRLVLFDTENKSLSWKERKQEDLRALAGCDRQCAMLVCADKLSNLRDISEDLEREGETAVFARFKRGKEEQEWLYRGCSEALAQLSDLPMYKELTETVETVFCKRRENHAGNH